MKGQIAPAIGGWVSNKSASTCTVHCPTWKQQHVEKLKHKNNFFKIFDLKDVYSVTASGGRYSLIYITIHGPKSDTTLWTW